MYIRGAVNWNLSSDDLDSLVLLTPNKGIGIINTPVLVQLIPFAGGIFAFGVFFQMIKDLKEQMKEMKSDIKQIDKRLTHVEIVVDKI